MTEPGPPGQWTTWRTTEAEVLIIGDSPTWRSSVALLLDSQRYVVHLSESFDRASDSGPSFDVALVDLAIAGGVVAGVSALRTHSRAPILAIASAGCRETEVLEAYAAGVDLLVARSIQSPELVARIRSLLRRSAPRSGSTQPGLGRGPAVTLDPTTVVAAVAGVELALTHRETEILHALVLRYGNVVTRDQFTGLPAGRPSGSVLDSFVGSLRRKLEAVDGRRRIITVRGVGFRLVHDWELDGSAPPDCGYGMELTPVVVAGP